MTWNDGYVVDVAYTEQAYREMTPVWLSLASVLNRQPPVDTTRPFTYVELGCGRGLTACTIAATHPTAEVWACDFNPAHVERARQWATDARLDNCAFEEASFEDLAEDREVGPSQADVIALHGVFSWVSPVNRRHIVDIIRTRLRPGGLVYVSYNVPTGWAGMAAPQQAMRLQVATDRRPSDVAIRSAVATIQQLADEGGRSFPLGPREQHMLDGLSRYDPAYAAHEYLGGSFTPMMFADVAGELSGAKCVYVGSTSLHEAIPELRVHADLQGIVGSAPDVALRETFCDLSNQTMFRGDIYRRGLALLSGSDHLRHIDELEFVDGGMRLDPTRDVGFGGGTLKLDEQHYRPLVERLANGPVTGRELRAMSVFAGRSEAEVRMSIAVLVTTGHAIPAIRHWEQNGGVDRARTMNRTLIESAWRGNFPGVLVSPARGGVVSVPPLVAMAIGEHGDGAALAVEPLVAALGARLEAQQMPLFKDGIALTDQVAIRSALVEAATAAIQLLSGQFETLGIRAVHSSRRDRQGSAKRRRS